MALRFFRVKNTGKGFLTIQDRISFNVEEIIPHLWVAEQSQEFRTWAEAVNAHRINRTRALALIAQHNANLVVDPDTGEMPADAVIPAEVPDYSPNAKKRASGILFKRNRR